MQSGALRQGARIRDSPPSVLPSDDRYQPALAATPVKLGLGPTSRQVSLAALHSEPDNSDQRSWGSSGLEVAAALGNEPVGLPRQPIWFWSLLGALRVRSL